MQHIKSNTSDAFAAVLRNGSVVTWGNPGTGGASSRVTEQLRHVQHIQATSYAFAVVRGDEVTWGHPNWGGDSSHVQD